MSPQWSRWAERLASVPIERRAADFGAMLAMLPECEAGALEALMDAHGLDGMPPLPSKETSSEGTSGDGVSAHETTADAFWPPLRMWGPPNTPAFPAGIFPPLLEEFCREVAAVTLCPLDFVAVAMLTTAGAAVSQSVNPRVRSRWNEAALLYSIIVAPPGKAKTPAIRAGVRPLVEIDERLRAVSKLARESWESASKALAKDPKAHAPGPEPPQFRAIVRDTTTSQAG